MYVCVCERLKVSHAPQCGVRAVLVKEKASGAKPGEEPQQYIEVCVGVCCVDGLATLYKTFRHPPYGHVIKLRVCGARCSLPARDLSYRAVFSLPKLTNRSLVGAVSLPLKCFFVVARDQHTFIIP